MLFVPYFIHHLHNFMKAIASIKQTDIHCMTINGFVTLAGHMVVVLQSFIIMSCDAQKQACVTSVDTHETY